MPDHDHLAEISDDSDDRDSDYGRGWHAGSVAALTSLRAELEELRVAHEQRQLFPAALAHVDAVSRIDAALLDLEDAAEVTR